MCAGLLSGIQCVARRRVRLVFSAGIGRSGSIYYNNGSIARILLPRLGELKVYLGGASSVLDSECHIATSSSGSARSREIGSPVSYAIQIYSIDFGTFTQDCQRQASKVNSNDRVVNKKVFSNNYG